MDNLSVDFEVGAGTFHAVRDVTFRIDPGRVVGIVGETGCGKSTLAQSIPRLLPEPPARIRSGKIRFRGMDLMQIPKWKLPLVRGTGISMIFQEPINSLNPAYRVFDQLAEAVRVRRLRESGRAPGLAPAVEGFDYTKRPTPGVTEVLAKPLVPPALEKKRLVNSVDREVLRKDALEYLQLVRINDPETILGLYPHELSGGMRQRIMIAMALSERPSLLIADEPTSALDITIQAQVLTLMKELIEQVRTSILFISHDLGVIAEMADDVGVMYAGHLVEFGPVAEVYSGPKHPYTKALLKANPLKYKDDGALPSLSGSVPNLSRLPSGCTFRPRCALARAKCEPDPGPRLETIPGSPDGRHSTACFFSDEVESLP